MDLYTFFYKLFNSKYFGKNITVTILLLILVGLNILGIDIKYLSQSLYLLVTLIIINIFITIVFYSFTSYYFKTITGSVQQIEELSELIEDSKEDYDLIKSKITYLDENMQYIIRIIKELSEELKGLPNIKALKLILELRTRGLWNELFRECLKYTLTYQRESSEIILGTFKNNVDDINKDYIEFIKRNIKMYGLHENISEQINNKINNTKDIIINELSKDKRIDEKLYIISLLLKSLQDEINEIILEYLRSVQANIL